jgi:uroporphyrinogen-III synthase
LLQHPALADVAQRTVLLVKGVGGRELLEPALTARGAHVETLDAYRRCIPADRSGVPQLEAQWRDSGIDIVTLTSVEILDSLLSMLSADGRALLAATPFVTLSARIADAARAQGLAGTCVLSRNADDDALVGAIAAWHARAR